MPKKQATLAHAPASPKPAKTLYIYRNDHQQQICVTPSKPNVQVTYANGKFVPTYVRTGPYNRYCNEFQTFTGIRVPPHTLITVELHVTATECCSEVELLTKALEEARARAAAKK